ncbi:MAG: deoxyribonuclease, partial [Lentisphaeria bacterium]|nr:deoxyribonuclease [Lentisphaeria bacterium]
MSIFIYEDDIEVAVLGKLAKPEFGYDIIKCFPDPDKRESLDDGTFRSSKKECVLPHILKSSLVKINPHIPESIIDEVVKSLAKDFSGQDLTAVNYDLYNKIRNQIKVKVRRNGKDDFDFVKLVDFDTPDNNTFTAVSQMWIQGKLYWRRPDVLIFINGLPLVFIELKNSIVKVEEAYNKNLKDYMKDIPNLFAFNQICVLSNGLETRLGAFNATYDYFFEWLKVDSEKEKPNRNDIRNEGVSISYFIDGLLK